MLEIGKDFFNHAYITGGDGIMIKADGSTTNRKVDLRTSAGTNAYKLVLNADGSLESNATSTSLGSQTKASGNYSTAMGIGSRAE